VGKKRRELSLNKDKIKTKILARKNLFQRLTCLSDKDVTRLIKDEIYYGIELENTFRVFSSANLTDKNGQSTYIGEYSKKRLLNRAKHRDDQINSIIDNL